MCKKTKDTAISFEDINTDIIKTFNVKVFFRPEELERELQTIVEKVIYTSLECAIIIHGYGDHYGGTHIIHDRTRKFLDRYKNSMWVVKGEDFNIFNTGALEIRNKHPEMEQYMRVCNHGVTIIAKKEKKH